MSVEDGLPGFLDELDDPVGVGCVGVVAVIPHGRRRWSSILSNVLVQVAPVWVVCGIESLSCSFGLIVAVLLSDSIAKLLTEISGVEKGLS